MNYTTVESIQLCLFKETLTAFEEAILADLLPQVDGMIDDYCGWTMLATDYTDKAYTGNGVTELPLHLWPINTVTKVTLDGVDITASVTFSAEDGTISYTNGTFTLNGKVLVTFNAGYGYNAAPIPGAIKYAANFLACTIFKQISNDSLGMSEAKFQSLDVKMDSGELPKIVRDNLKRYRMVRIY